MSESIESKSQKSSEQPFAGLLEKRTAEGWQYLGREGLAQTKFNNTDGKFEDIPFQTEEEIKQKYINLVSKVDPKSHYEVELVLDENSEKLNRLKADSTEE